jgi:hypothetical protein
MECPNNINREGVPTYLATIEDVSARRLIQLLVDSIVEFHAQQPALLASPLISYSSPKY